jgi:hypothetical protein
VLSESRTVQEISTRGKKLVNSDHPTGTDLSLVEIRLGHIVGKTNTLVVAMQPCVITTGLVGHTWNIYSMMQVSWTITDTITVTLDTAIVVVAAVLRVQHHPAATKYNSHLTGKQIHSWS